MKNKKGDLGGASADFYAFVAFAIIVLVFYLIFSFSGTNKKEEIESYNQNLEANVNVINILQSQVEYDNQKITMYDLFQLTCDKYQNDEDFQSVLDYAVIPEVNGFEPMCYIKYFKCPTGVRKLFPPKDCSCRKFGKLKLPTINSEIIEITYCEEFGTMKAQLES